jgi:hypothetical protein
MRASFFAIGLFVTLCGASLLFIDRIALKADTGSMQRQAGLRGMMGFRPVAQPKIIDPPEWAAFSLLSVGSVTMLYSFALPSKKQDG